MFKLQPNPTFTSQVQISVPGKADQATITVTFKHLSKPQIKTYFEGVQGKTDAEALSEIITDWEGIDAKFNAESLQTLLENYPASGGELYEAFRINLMESRRKNS